MKIIVTHASPDWDAIGSVWLIKKYLAGWERAEVRFVPAGENISKIKDQRSKIKDPVERIGEDEVVHVDTGMGPLDHHQTSDREVCAMSRTWDFVRNEIESKDNALTDNHLKAISRIVRVVVDIDHFGEVYWGEPTADYHEFSLLGVLEGLKYIKQDQDEFYVEFGMQCLDALVADFENRIWAEDEIAKGQKFVTRFGEGIGFETINDTVLKLAQKMGYILVVRKDPRKKYVRIKARPHPDPLPRSGRGQALKGEGTGRGIDLTLAYEQLKKIDPEATWYLHVSKKMLLNGTPKNPKMRPTKLGLDVIIKVLEKI